MTTRSGRAYKSTVETMDELKKMMAELVADRQKRDEEFAASVKDEKMKQLRSGQEGREKWSEPWKQCSRISTTSCL